MHSCLKILYAYISKRQKIIIAFATIIILLGFTEAVTPPTGNWYQQFMPNIGNRQIKDITFTDSLNGYAITSISNDTSFVMRTTNSGNNWFFSHFDYFANGAAFYNRIIFINQNTGFVGGYINRTYLLKTTNSGINWSYINAPFDQIAFDMAVLDQNTIWLVDNDGLVGGVFYTSNGGTSWQQQAAPPSDKIYMYNRNIGFISVSSGIQLHRTTNGGVNWIQITGENGFTDMHFVDSLTGWKANGDMKKTTNGGTTWTIENLPSVNWISTMVKFTSVNKDTLWGVGGVIQWVPSTNNFRGIVYKTTNGGLNWGYQIPDTGANYYQLLHIKFVNKFNGWTYLPVRNQYTGFNGFHTTNGGDSVSYFGIQQISSDVPKDFQLKQNYPNPFNPRTVIRFSLKKAAYVKLIAYDITGREVQRMVDGKYSAGEYETDFMGKFTASGVYFYQLTISNEQLTEVYRETKKMVLLK